MPDPGVLGFLCDLGGHGAALSHGLDDVRHMFDLFFEVQGQGGVESALVVTGGKQVGETVGHHAVQGFVPAVPVLVHGKPIAPLENRNTPASIQIAGHLITAGEHDAVHFVLFAVDHDAVFGQALDALGFGHIQQRHVGAVEGLVILIVGGGPLALVAIPGLQQLGGGFILDNLIDPAPQAFHNAEIHLFIALRERLLTEFGPALLFQFRGDIAIDLGPDIPDQVLLPLAETLVGAAVEVGATLGLPAGFKGFHPLGISLRVAARIDTGRGALQQIKVFGVLTQKRHQLDRGRAGTHQRDLFILQLVQYRVFFAATGVVIVPTRGMEHVTLEVLNTGNTRELGNIEQAIGHDHETRPNLITLTGFDLPAFGLFVPAQ